MAGVPTRDVASVTKKEQERRDRFSGKGKRLTGRRGRWEH
jgi:hypothetical protein